MMAGAPELYPRVESLVMKSGRPAADALRQAADESAHQLAQLRDPVLAERADDVRSLGRRAAARANGFEPGVIGGGVIANTLGPAAGGDAGAKPKAVGRAGG